MRQKEPTLSCLGMELPLSKEAPKFHDSGDPTAGASTLPARNGHSEDLSGAQLSFVFKGN